MLLCVKCRLNMTESEMVTLKFVFYKKSPKFLYITHFWSPNFPPYSKIRLLSHGLLRIFVFIVNVRAILLLFVLKIHIRKVWKNFIYSAMLRDILAKFYAALIWKLRNIYSIKKLMKKKLILKILKKQLVRISIYKTITYL